MKEILDRLCDLDPKRWRCLGWMYGFGNGDSWTAISVDVVSLICVGCLMQWLADMGFKPRLEYDLYRKKCWSCWIVGKNVLHFAECPVHAVLDAIYELYECELIEVENA